MKKQLLFLLAVFLLVAGATYGQTVSGRVTAADDTAPLPGVSVLVKGTTTGTATDSDGRFSLSAPPYAVLVVSFIGYATREIPVEARTVIDIALEEDVSQLEEVVVTAFGISKETKSLGYATSTVSAKSLNPDFAAELCLCFIWQSAWRPDCHNARRRDQRRQHHHPGCQFHYREKPTTYCVEWYTHPRR